MIILAVRDPFGLDCSKDNPAEDVSFSDIPFIAFKRGYVLFDMVREKMVSLNHTAHAMEDVG